MKKKTLCLITKYPSIIYHIYLTTYSQYHTTVQYSTVHKNYFSFGKWNTVWLICMCVYMWRLLRLYDAASVLITNRQQQCPHIFQQKTRPFRKVCLDHGSFSFFISCYHSVGLHLLPSSVFFFINTYMSLNKPWECRFWLFFNTVG